MKILMVTPYPPHRDGIAAYAAQQVKALRTAGHDVRVLSPGPSAAHEHLDLLGPRGALALAKRTASYDKVIVQFHPDFFYAQPATGRSRVGTSLALAVALRRARRAEVVIHEIDYRHGSRRGPAGLATRAMWRSVDTIVVHTASERSMFAAAFGVRQQHIEVAEHGASFLPRTFHDRAGARETLGIGAEQFVFLAIGFIQPHKGFDRAIEAFRGLDGVARLDVVGSVRVEDPAFIAHAEELAELAEDTPGVHLHVGYVSDELFDRWIVAADVVVLPYRSIWSSGVLERARLFNRPVVASATGGLPEQAGEAKDVTLVASDAELRDAMWALAGGGSRARVRTWGRTLDGPAGGGRLRDAVQAEVRSRAGAARGSRVAASADPVVAARAGRASAALRRSREAGLPPPTSLNPLAALMKRVVRRLTAWQLGPLVDTVNELRAAAIKSVELSATADRQVPGTGTAVSRAASEAPGRRPADR